jgi:hypothetical protein
MERTMLVSRAGLIRGLAVGAAALPFAARGAAPVRAGKFQPDLKGAGVKPWTSVPVLGASPLRFVVIGDHTGLARPGVFEQGLRQASWLQPDFILSVGDLIEGYTQDRAEIARQWAAVDHAIAATGLPFVHTPGNHDVDNAETLDAWRERRGASYYSFTFKGALFIVMNTEDTPTPMTDKQAKHFYSMVDMMKADPDKAEKTIADYIKNKAANHNEYAALDAVNFGDRQIAFLGDTLARNAHVRWTFVVFHKPAWKMEDKYFPRIRALLKGRNYTVFAGHTHYFTHEVIDGADYINMGTTGGIRAHDGPGTMDHVMLVTLGAEGPIFANQRLNGLMDVTGATGQVRAY